MDGWHSAVGLWCNVLLLPPARGRALFAAPVASTAHASIDECLFPLACSCHDLCMQRLRRHATSSHATHSAACPVSIRPLWRHTATDAPQAAAVPQCDTVASTLYVDSSRLMAVSTLPSALAIASAACSVVKNGRMASTCWICGEHTTATTFTHACHTRTHDHAWHGMHM